MTLCICHLHSFSGIYGMWLTNIVFPFPGGPKRSNPLQGDRSPVNSCRHSINGLMLQGVILASFIPTSGLSAGKTTISWRARLGNSRPTAVHLIYTYSYTVWQVISWGANFRYFRG